MPPSRQYEHQREVPGTPGALTCSGVSLSESDDDSDMSDEEIWEEGGDWGDTEAEIDQLYAHMVERLDPAAAELGREESVYKDDDWDVGGTENGHDTINELDSVEMDGIENLRVGGYSEDENNERKLEGDEGCLC